MVEEMVDGARHRPAGDRTHGAPGSSSHSRPFGKGAGEFMIRLLLVLFTAASTTFRLTRLIFAVRKARREGTGRITSKPIFWVMTSSYFVYLTSCFLEGWQKASTFSAALWGLG